MQAGLINTTLAVPTVAPSPSFHRVAVFSDTHLWPELTGRDRFAKWSASLPVRDGLLVHRQPLALAPRGEEVDGLE